MEVRFYIELSIYSTVSYCDIIIVSKSFYFFSQLNLKFSIFRSSLFILVRRGSINSYSFFLNSPFKPSSSYSIFSLMLPMYLPIRSFSSNSMSAKSWSSFLLVYACCVIILLFAKID